MSFRLEGKFVFFATNNLNKFNEARGVMKEYNISVGMLRLKGMEIQSDSLAEIAQASGTDVVKKYGLPVIVEDAGLFVGALNGFPGPYAAYVYRTVGNQGLLKLMEKVNNRKATFRSVVAYISESKEPAVFDGEIAGEIVLYERTQHGEHGFGFDPIFMPSGSPRTFAEMDLKEKNQYSHRAKALRRFAEWYKKL